MVPLTKPVADPLEQLVEAWTDKAEELKELAPATAAQFAYFASELRKAIAGMAGELLTLEQAAAISGYSAGYLGDMIAAGQLRNYGRKHSPRVRRGDLPRKPAPKAGIRRPSRAPLEELQRATRATALRKHG